MLGIEPEDLDLPAEGERLLFDKDKEVTFLCVDPKEHKGKQQLILNCKVLDGDHAGKLHTLYLSQKRDQQHHIRRLRDFGKAFYTEAEIRKRDTPLSRLYNRKFTAIPEAPREYNGKWYQDFGKWHDLGEMQADGTTAPPQTGATQSTAPATGDVPF